MQDSYSWSQNQKGEKSTNTKSKIALFSSLPQKHLGVVTAFKQQPFNQGVLLIHENCSQTNLSNTSSAIWQQHRDLFPDTHRALVIALTWNSKALQLFWHLNLHGLQMWILFVSLWEKGTTNYHIFLIPQILFILLSPVISVIFYSRKADCVGPWISTLKNSY